MNQKFFFLRSEGDNWYLRNKSNKQINKPLYKIIKKIIEKNQRKKLNILEVGSSSGKFLNYIKRIYKNHNYFGLDPSRKALDNLKKKKINGIQGTADKIILNRKIDILIYGFCLYLCDKEDYNKIEKSAYKILNKNGKILIFDFFSKKEKKVVYKYNKKIFAYKSDFRKIFTKKNNFKCTYHKKYNYHDIFQTKKKIKNDLVSISVIERKNKIIADNTP